MSKIEQRRDSLDPILNRRPIMASIDDRKFGNALPLCFWVSIMPSIAGSFDRVCSANQSHTCPKCLGPMILTHIKPSRIGLELRTFQGVICNHVDKVVTETYSMKWAYSSLRAPV